MFTIFFFFLKTLSAQKYEIEQNLIILSLTIIKYPKILRSIAKILLNTIKFCLIHENTDKFG
jgi:hypothetical protein